MLRLRLPLLLLAALLFPAGPDAARAADPFESFIVGLRATCARAPATRCVAAVHAFLDADRSGKVEQADLDTVRQMATATVGNSGTALNAVERSSIAVALMIVKHAGLPQVVAGFDTNGDGGIDRKEMFQDFRIDRRPFGTIVRDPDSVNWSAFAQRFGKVGFLITDLLPPSHRR